ncbi:MAG: ParB/RepB/Spo0J family partition protein, partial [Candidatus Nitrosopolaris sp.]
MKENKIIVRMKEEYEHMMPPVTASEYERLKRSIKEEGRLLLPIVLNQDNVILDGHHRFQACQELGIPIRIDKKDFTGRPLDEMMYVVNVKLYRRSLNDFQRVEVGIRVEELRRKLGQHQQEASRFTPETSQEAHRQRYHSDEDADLPSGSPDPDRSESGKDRTRGGVSEEMAERVGVSRATYDRVRYILSNGTEEMIESLRKGYVEDEDTKNKHGSIGIRTSYEELRYQKLQSKLGSSSNNNNSVSTHSIAEQEVAEIDHYHGKDFEEKGHEEEGGVEIADDEHETISACDMPSNLHYEKENKKKEEKTIGLSLEGDHRRNDENVRLVNKDFRLVRKEEIQDGSIDLVLALSFPDPKIPEDEGGKIHEHLMSCAYRWLKEGGLVAMHVEQSVLPKVIRSIPPGFQFFRVICVLQQEKMNNETVGPIGMVT